MSYSGTVQTTRAIIICGLLFAAWILVACVQSSTPTPIPQSSNQPSRDPQDILIGFGSASYCLEDKGFPDTKKKIPDVFCEVADKTIIVNHIKLTWPNSVPLAEARQELMKHLPIDAKMTSTKTAQDKRSVEELYNSSQLLDEIKTENDGQTATGPTTVVPAQVDIVVNYHMTNDRVELLDVNLVNN